ncbi:TIGR01244 family sulfur transferase [Sphingorhabdus arenilitoris]|uniref:TIGR01244 family sulfur transferase n=1 Tax=Sphingorhabdus arenilitoris TaxID=1490041 RepID=A0ABV8RDP6_9SPHN
MFRKIEDHISVSPQITLADIAAAKAQGVTIIVNNRPDGEDPSAPQGAEIEAAARAAGMDYVAIPVTHAGFSRSQIDAMNAALEKAKDGKMLAYCRSGTRSTLLWALAEAAKGESPRVIAAKAADAGYDVAPIQMMLDTLSGAAKSGPE